MNRQNLQVDSLKPKTNVMTSVLLQNVQLQTETNYREKKHQQNEPVQNLIPKPDILLLLNEDVC